MVVRVAGENVLRPLRPLLAGGGQDGRHEVGEALAHAGARLDHQMMPPLDRPIDGLGHVELLSAVFVVWQPGRDPSAGAEDFER